MKDQTKQTTFCAKLRNARWSNRRASGPNRFVDLNERRGEKTANNFQKLAEAEPNSPPLPSTIREREREREGGREAGAYRVSWRTPWVMYADQIPATQNASTATRDTMLPPPPSTTRGRGGPLPPRPLRAVTMARFGSVGAPPARGEG
ncbi:Os06g0592950, partial [Oryza sativa Japonica Group]